LIFYHSCSKTRQCTRLYSDSGMLSSRSKHNQLLRRKTIFFQTSYTQSENEIM
jgi:hypothetical protein